MWNKLWFGNQKQSQIGQNAVKHEHFVSEFVSEHLKHYAIHCVTDDGWENGDEGNTSVARLQSCGHAEGEESQQWSVGVAGDGVDGVNDAGVVQCLEAQDEQDEDDHHAQVYPLSSPLWILKWRMWVTLLIFNVIFIFHFRSVLYAKNVDAEAGGESRQGRVGTGEGGCNDADGEEDQYGLSHGSRGNEVG